MMNVDKSMCSPKLFLYRWVFYCISHNHCIFLHLDRDEYFCLDLDAAGMLANHVEGWPSQLRKGGETAIGRSREVAEQLGDLVKAGVLTANENQGKQAVPVEIDLPIRTLQYLVEGSAVRRSAKLRDSASFCLACAGADLKLRWRPLANVVRGFARQKAQRRGRGRGVDLSRTEQLVTRFGSLRPWFPRSSLCLFESLALLGFLAHHDIFPTWVFGVRTEPFGAHCWVQDGEVLLNDRIDHVRRFTPIMAV